MLGSMSRRSASAEAFAISRNPAGSNSAMFAAKAATCSAGASGENMLGSMAATNSGGDSRDASRLRRRRSATTSAGNEPAQPAYALARTSFFGMSGCRRKSSSAITAPNDSPAT